MHYDGLDRLTAATIKSSSGDWAGNGTLAEERTREQGTGTNVRGTGSIRTRTMSYDALNRVTYESLPDSASNTMTYDLTHRRSDTSAGLSEEVCVVVVMRPRRAARRRDHHHHEHHEVRAASGAGRRA